MPKKNSLPRNHFDLDRDTEISINLTESEQILMFSVMIN